MAARHPPCRALKPKEKDYKVTDRDGMFVHVTAKGAMVHQLGLADSRLCQISRAVRWIRDHHAEMLRIEDLARVANVSATSFFLHFGAVTSLTPIQYQKQVRLQEARAKLRASPGDVAAVGYAVGLESFRTADDGNLRN